MSKSKLKKSIEEGGGFRHWFVNVFWFHYKWPVLIGFVVLGIIVFITWDSLRKTRYDTTVVIATDYYVDQDELDALDKVLKPVVGDLDGNGQVNIYYAVLYLGDTEVGRQNEERMYLYMTQNDVGLYLMSDNVSDAYTNPELGYFTDDVDQYGLEADPNNSVRVDLTGSSLMTECGLENMYMSIMDFTTNDGGSTAQQSLDTAISMANAIVKAG